MSSHRDIPTILDEIEVTEDEHRALLEERLDMQSSARDEGARLYPDNEMAIANYVIDNPEIKRLNDEIKDIERILVSLHAEIKRKPMWLRAKYDDSLVSTRRENEWDQDTINPLLFSYAYGVPCFVYEKPDDHLEDYPELSLLFDHPDLREQAYDRIHSLISEHIARLAGNLGAIPNHRYDTLFNLMRRCASYYIYLNPDMHETILRRTNSDDHDTIRLAPGCSMVVTHDPLGFISSLPDDPVHRVWNELTPAHLPNRIRLDIDAKLSEIDGDIDAHRIPLRDAMIDVLKRKVLEIYEVELKEHDICICSTNRPEKISYHIIVNNYYLPDRRDGAHLVKEMKTLAEELYPDYAPFFDTAPMTSGNLRMVYNYKPGVAVRKTIDTNHKPEHTLISSPDFSTDEMLIRVIPYEEPDDLDDFDPVLGRTKTMSRRFKRFVGKLVSDRFGSIFNTNKPRQPKNGKPYLYYGRNTGHRECELCQLDRKNGHENASLQVIVRKTGISCVCARSRYHDHPDAEITLYPHKLTHWMKRAMMTELVEKNYCPIPEVEDTITIDEESIKPSHLATSDTLFIRSPMGTAKTKAILEHLRTHPKTRVLMVSFRQSFTDEMLTRYREFHFEDYRILKRAERMIDMSQHPRVIVQYESLNFLRFRMRGRGGYPDLMILDESESIIGQAEHLCNHVANARERFEAFSAAIKYSKQVICLDAFLTNRTVNTIREIRRNKPKLIVNNTKPWTNRRFILLEEDRMLNSIKEALKAGIRIVVVTNRKKFGRKVKKMVAKYAPSFKCGLYTAEDGDKSDLADVHSSWNELDCLIYSPTVQAGISFEADRFERLYAYFTDHSTDAQGCVQMLARVRNFNDKLSYMSFPDQLEGTPVDPTIDSQRLLIMSTVNGIEEQERVLAMLGDATTFYYDEEGDRRVKRDKYIRMRSRNLNMNVHSKRYFVDDIRELLSVQGAETVSWRLLDDSEIAQGVRETPDKEEQKELERETKADMTKRMLETGVLTRDQMREIAEVGYPPAHLQAEYEKTKEINYYGFKDDATVQRIASNEESMKKIRNPQNKELHATFKEFNDMQGEMDATTFEREKKTVHDRLKELHAKKDSFAASDRGDVYVAIEGPCLRTDIGTSLVEACGVPMRDQSNLIMEHKIPVSEFDITTVKARVKKVLADNEEYNKRAKGRWGMRADSVDGRTEKSFIAGLNAYLKPWLGIAIRKPQRSDYYIIETVAPFAYDTNTHRHTLNV